MFLYFTKKSLFVLFSFWVNCRHCSMPQLYRQHFSLIRLFCQLFTAVLNEFIDKSATENARFICLVFVVMLLIFNLLFICVKISSNITIGHTNVVFHFHCWDTEFYLSTIPSTLKASLPNITFNMFFFKTQIPLRISYVTFFSHKVHRKSFSKLSIKVSHK